VDGIERVLENPEACKVFEKFLTKEFSAENLLCYKTIQSLQDRLERKEMSDEGALYMSTRISREFCGVDCRLPVNISSTTMSQVSAISADTPLAEALDSLKKMKLEVLNLMKNDSFL
jgi:hypothetical protein